MVVLSLRQRGYTFLAEAYTPDTPPVGGKWRMRLIGSRDPLPQLAREAPINNFIVKEFRDYYIPNDKNMICRYSNSMSEAHHTCNFLQSRLNMMV